MIESLKNVSLQQGVHFLWQPQGVHLCVLLAMKNDQLKFWQLMKKKNAYTDGLSCANIHGIQAKMSQHNNYIVQI